MTLSAWVNPSSLTGESGNNYVISTQRRYNIINVNSSANFSYVDRVGGAHTYTGATIPLNTWTLLTVSCQYDNTHTLSTTTMYINGSQVKQDTGTTPCDYNQTQIFYIGATGQSLGHFGWTGFIDDARVYSRALSDSDVLQLFNIGNDITSNLDARYSWDNSDTTYTLTGTILDTSGNAVNAQFATSPPGTSSSTPGIFNEAVRLTGINNTNRGGARVQSGALVIGTGDFSISVWSKAVNNAFSGMLITLSAGAANNGYAFYWNAGTLTWAVQRAGAGQTITTSVTMDGTTWHHFVATYENTTGVMTLFVDGVEKSSSATSVPTGNITNQNAQPSIGLNFASNPAQDISLDEMCVYARELSSNEVLSLYNKGTGATCTSSAPAVTIFPRFMINFGTLILNGGTLLIR